MAASNNLNTNLFGDHEPEPGLLNGRLLRQPPRSANGNPFAGKYMNTENGGIQTEGGVYDKDEFEQHTAVASKGLKHIQNENDLDGDDEDEANEAKDYQRRFTSPLQGMLFDPSESREDREDALRQHYVSTYAHGDQTHDYHSDTEDEVHHQINRSNMPNELVKALGGLTSVKRGGPEPMGGWYSGYIPGGPITLKSDRTGIGVNHDTTIHELGHRADFRSHNAEGGMEGRHSIAVPPTVSANPRLEGIADGFMDRYSNARMRPFLNAYAPQTHGEWSHLSNSGYSVGFDGTLETPTRNNNTWNDEERAVYGAARAHFGKTGENPTIPGMEGVTVKQNSDEYLHMMLRTSPHARQALMAHNDYTDTHGPLWNAASRASRWYLGTRKVGTQLSMLDEVQTTTNSTPDGPSPTIHDHTAGYTVRHSLLSPEGQAAEQQRKENMVSSFQPPEGHSLVTGTSVSMDRAVYDDPYANGVSQEQHAKTVASELASVKAKQDKARQSRRAARGSV
jgi:hypothetical protein